MFLTAPDEEGVCAAMDCERALQPVGEASFRQIPCLSPKGKFGICQKRALKAVCEVAGI